jgi:DNA replication protein DnaC
MIRSVKDSWRKGSEKSEEDVIRSFSEPDLLVVDEVGVQFGSDTEKLYLTEIINNRYERKMPTVLISNLNFEELEKSLGTRIIDRFFEGKSAILKFTWESYRRRDIKK